MVTGRTRNDIICLTVLWVVVSAIVEAVAAYLGGSHLGDASAEGAVTSEAIFFLLWVTIPVFVLIALVIIYAMLRFRVPDDDEAPSDWQYRSARAFPWGWVVVSTVLNLLFIIHPGLTGLTTLWSMASAASNPMEIDVTAAQWQWRFSYPGQELKGVQELVLPVGEPVRFVLASKDVIHSFWVPAWGIKKAVIPGQTRTLVVTPNRIMDTADEPRARVQCSQICGVGHAEMQSVVRVVSQEDFDRWVTATRAAAMKREMSMPGMTMPGTQMPGQGTAQPGMGKMQMPGSGTAAPGAGSMNMPAGEMPSQGSMPMGDQKPMTDTRPEKGTN